MHRLVWEIPFEIVSHKSAVASLANMARYGTTESVAGCFIECARGHHAEY